MISVPSWRCRHEVVKRRRGGPRHRGPFWRCDTCGERFVEEWRVQDVNAAVLAAEEYAARKTREAATVVAGQQLVWAELLRVFGVRKRQHLLDIGHALQAQARRGRVA